MEITIKIPDQVYKEDPTYKKYFEGLQMMVNRMAVSHFKYGRIDHNAGKIDEMKSGRQRLWMYDGKGPRAGNKEGNTGNTENLLDAANFFLIEFTHPQHRKAEFRAQSASESPGLVKA